MNSSGRTPVLTRFLPMLWRFRRSMGLSLLLSIIAVAALVLAPWPFKYIIDGVLMAQPLPAWLEGLTSGRSASMLVVTFGLVAALIATIGALSGAAAKMINARVRERMTLELRGRLLAHIQSLSVTHRSTDRTGDLSLRLVDDVHQLVRLLTKTMPLIMRHLLTMLTIFVVMFALEPRLGGVGVLIVVALAMLARNYAVALGVAAHDKRDREGSVASLSQEIMRGLPSIQALGAEQVVRRRFKRINRFSLTAGVGEVRVAVSMERAMQIATSIAYAAVVIWGGLLVAAGQLTLGSLTIYLAYITQLVKPVEKINDLASAIARGLARGRKLVELLDRPPAVVDAPHAIDIGHANGQLDISNLSFGYENGLTSRTPHGVLHNVQLSIAPRTLTAIVGPSGAGKSTLLMLLLRILEPEHGELRLDGRPYADIRLASLRRQFAVMMQESHLFAGRIRDCLQPPGPLRSDAALWRVLEQVALREFVRQLPGMLDAPVGEAAANLSGGQRARLGLARALLQERPILLLDEPLANVDQESGAIIIETLCELRRKRTCIAISHEDSIAAIADRIVLLDNGSIQELAVPAQPNAVLREALS